MIVRRTTDSLLLVRQVDHAALAADLIAPWHADGWPDRPSRAATLLAITHHDDGWRAEDDAPRHDESRGRPHDFLSIPTGRRHAIWRRSVQGLVDRSTYASALVAQHAITLARASRTDPTWTAFVAEMESTRDELYTAPSVDAIDPAPDDRLSFLRDYAMLAMGDLMSLVVCNGWTDVHEQDGYALWLDGERLCVRPDPFGGRQVAFGVAARRVAGTAFPTASALADAWSASEPVTLRGVVTGICQEPS